MAATEDPKVMVVTGDVTIDWNLARTRRSDSRGQAWNADDCARAYWQRGGAALLADLIDGVADDLRQSGHADYSLRQMGAPRDQASPGDPRFHHSYAMWSLFDYDFKSARDRDRPFQAWRVLEFLGLDPSMLGTPTNGPDWRQVVGDAEAEIVLLNDANLGFRDHRELWPRSVTLQTCEPWVVLKMGHPVAQGDLWKHLHRQHANRLIVVMTVNDLRLTEVEISRGLSWERTVQDLAWQLAHDPRINAFSNCAHVVISFENAGALLLSKRSARACQLFFDPKVIEGTWEQVHPGGMIGYTSCLTAGIMRQLMLSPRDPDISGGIQRGLAAMRRLHLEGYGVRGSSAADAALVFPTSLIASELARDAKPFSVADVHDPSIYLSNQSTPTKSAREAGFWTILEDRYSGSLSQAAEQVVVEGAEAALKDVPLGQFGNLLTVDRGEIESFRSIRELVGEYCRKHRQKRPLSIAVFGAPGLGKSFGIIEVANSLLPGEIKVLEFNLSRFSDPDELLDALHQVRDTGLSGFIPLVFWGEFDTALDGRVFGWLRHFLSAMQDGRFQQTSRPLGRCIFVFASGISESMESFGEGMSEQDFRAVKGPDFVSSLKGYVNILGPNPTRDSSDQFYVLRRGILLRSILRRDAPQLFERKRDKEVLNIDSAVLRALLYTNRYKHGVRSMESVIAMSQLTGKRQFNRSCLPGMAQLDLHVDAQDFQALLQKIELDGELLERLAEAAHDAFVNDIRDSGYTLGPKTDDALKTHSALKTYSELPEDEKEQNRGNVRDISNKLARAGYVMIPARSNEAPFDFPGADLDLLAEMEHERWMKAKIDGGWRWAPRTDKSSQLHQDLLPWRTLSDEARSQLSPGEALAIGPGELPEREKEKDRVLVRAIPTILQNGGFTVVKVQEAAEDLRGLRAPGEDIERAADSATRSPSRYVVFISYRREGGAETARAIRSELLARGIRAFLDVDDLESYHFDERLLREIENAPNFICVLSPGSLDRSIENEGDWLRREIAHAISHRRNIIPILKGGFRFPPQESLPADLAELPRYNCVEYSHIYFNATVDRLLTFFKTVRPPEDPHRQRR